MDDKPTVQMDAYSEESEPDRQGAEAPPTIPIEDLFRDEPPWPPPVDDPTPPRPVAAPQPPGHPAVSGGQTVILQPDTSAPLLAWLAVVEGPGAPRGQVFTVERETVIGRKTGHILLPGDACVSGHHARVRLESGGADDDSQSFVLYDLASSNGTFAGDHDSYQDQRIYRHELQDGDFILIGETTLVFKQVELGKKS